MALSGTDMDTRRLILKSGSLPKAWESGTSAPVVLVLSMRLETAGSACACAFALGWKPALHVSDAVARTTTNVLITFLREARG